MAGNRVVVNAIKIKQWLPSWDRVAFDSEAMRRKPDPSFYLLSMPATDLKALTGIYRRSAKGGLRRAQDLGIQRAHEAQRSNEIREFVQYGYPWSNLTAAQRQDSRFSDLRKPGWLPTAVVVNIVTEADQRMGQRVDTEDLILVNDAPGGLAEISIPQASIGWRPKSAFPIEVIDGQHRLWAFEDQLQGADFQVPVVAFRGLDISWQAYLFWTINIKPKRINASLAFDLYPLLRTEDWLGACVGNKAPT